MIFWSVGDINNEVLVTHKPKAKVPAQKGARINVVLDHFGGLGHHKTSGISGRRRRQFRTLRVLSFADFTTSSANWKFSHVVAESIEGV